MTRRIVPAVGSVMLSLLLLTGSLASAAGGAFVDPLSMPAPKAAKAAQGPLRALAQAGQRLVAVGIRGRIVVSDDAGTRWAQASVPVSSDLNAVTFVDAMQGWAVGHDGVILHTSDGGMNWKVQLDGLKLEALITQYYSNAEQAGKAQAAKLLEDVRNLMQPGPASFFMDVAFEDALHGLAVGKFGLILATQDGGASWQPWLEHIDNPEFLHLTAMRRIAGQTWIVGERGSVWRVDTARQHAQRLQVGYNGGLFGIVGDDTFVLAYGLRGNAFRSTDNGKSWKPVSTGIVGGISDASLWAQSGVVLAAQSGQLALSNDAGRTFQPLAAQFPTLFSAVIGLPQSKLALVGLNGVHVQQSDPENHIQAEKK